MVLFINTAQGTTYNIKAVQITQMNINITLPRYTFVIEILGPPVAVVVVCFVFILCFCCCLFLYVCVICVCFFSFFFFLFVLVFFFLFVLGVGGLWTVIRYLKLIALLATSEHYNKVNA